MNLTMTAKEAFRLAWSIARGERLIAFEVAWDSYDEYCEMTSYDDYDPDDSEWMDNYEQMRDERESRRERAKEEAQKVIEKHKANIPDQYLKICYRLVAERRNAL